MSVKSDGGGFKKSLATSWSTGRGRRTFVRPSGVTQSVLAAVFVETAMSLGFHGASRNCTLGLPALNSQSRWSDFTSTSPVAGLSDARMRSFRSG